MLCCVTAIEASNMQILAKRMRTFSTCTATCKYIAKDAFKALRLPYVDDMQKRRVVKREERIPTVSRNLSPTEDWTVVWPVARTAHPELIGFPLRQGYPAKGKPPMPKEYSIELLKIPNFLHLSPRAITKHCTAIKKFCTKWPEALKSTEDCNKHFPMEIIYSDYCYTGPSPREPLARIVTLKLKLSTLNLDNRAKDKFIRLVGERYDHHTDIVTLTSDRCPVRKQNLEYLKYVLTAVYHESQNVEPWEAEKSEEDMEYYDWDKSQSRKSIESLLQWNNPPTDIDERQTPRVPEYKKAVSDLMNKGENGEHISMYKDAVKDLLGLKQTVNLDTYDAYCMKKKWSVTMSCDNFAPTINATQLENREECFQRCYGDSATTMSELMLISFFGMLHWALASRTFDTRQNKEVVDIQSVIRTEMQAAASYCEIPVLCRVVKYMKGLLSGIWSVSPISHNERVQEPAEIQEKNYYSGYGMSNAYYPLFDPLSVLASLAFLAFLLQSLAPLFDRPRSMFSTGVRARHSRNLQTFNTAKLLDEYDNRNQYLIAALENDIL